MPSGLKILHLTYRDSSGVPSRWAAAHDNAGHETLLLSEFMHPYVYSGRQKVQRWTPGTGSAEERAERIAVHLEWADVVMAYDHPFYLDAAIASGKPVLFRALGTSSRENVDEIRDLLASPAVIRATAGTADLSILLDIGLVGAPYPLPDVPADPAGMILCHAPSDRDLKKTVTVLRAAAKTGWRIDLIEHASNEMVLARKRRAAAIVDSGPGAVPDGYGVNSIEAMALGLPAVAGASAGVRELMEVLGSPVVLVDSEDDLVAVLERLRNADEREQLGQAGRKFVARFHSGAERAREDLNALSLLKTA